MKNTKNELLVNLKEADKVFDNEIDFLKGTITSDKFEKLIDFTMIENEADIDLELLNSRIEEKKGQKGIYLFEVFKSTDSSFEKWLEEFRIKFMGEDACFRHQWTPNLTKKRYAKYDQENTDRMWVPLYIGKSKKMRERINQHIYYSLGKPPFGLKLKDKNTLIGEKFRIKIIPLPIKNYDFFAPFIEKYLRDLTKPIAGK